MTLAELKAAGDKAANIERALERLKNAEHTLRLVNRYAAENEGKSWSPELQLSKDAGQYSYASQTAITVKIPHEFIVRQAINEVIDARRKVVLAGGDLPTASEQVQRGRR